MNKLVTRLLGGSLARVACATALASVPHPDRYLGLVRPPAGQAFAAFVQALQAADPHAPTECAGWTVHELTAHLAAGSEELADLIERELSGAPSRPTRSFEEREAPYRALPPAALRRVFFEQSLRATVALERLMNAGHGSRVAFTGVLLDAPTLVLHIESELVLHRWDLARDDATSISALSDHRYAVHAVTTVAAMAPNVFAPRTGRHETIVLRASGGPDIAVTGGPMTAIHLAAQDHSYPVVECHPAARTLMLWGRSPGPALPAPVGPSDAVVAVVEMLSPSSVVTSGA